MKKYFLKLVIIFIIILLIINLLLFIYIKINNPYNIRNFFFDKNSVSYNGWLKTKNSNLYNNKNKFFQLRGVSSHGIEWYSDIISYDTLKHLKEEWNINIFRIAMYTDSHDSGYIYNKEKNYNKVCEIIDIAIELDIYVIVDWHILYDNDPLQHIEESKLFFNLISEKYSKYPNVIYEICNEPNQNNVTWERNIKPYAETIIPIIRNNSPKSLIIVGTPHWCTDLETVAESPLNFDNILYSCHFYAGSHSEELREKINLCLNKNLPIIISECGITDASGDGQLYIDEFNTWINYLNNNIISWIYWSFSDKNETSAILIPDKTINDLTSAGLIIKELLKNVKK